MPPPVRCSITDWDCFSSPQDGKLYWCDARTDKIERIDLETGENREVVLSSNNMDMFSVSVFEEYIYWSDRYGAQRFWRCWGSPAMREGGGSWRVLWGRWWYHHRVLLRWGPRWLLGDSVHP